MIFFLFVLLDNISTNGDLYEEHFFQRYID